MLENPLIMNSLRHLVAVAALGFASVLPAFAQSSNSSAAQTSPNREANNPDKHWVGTWAASPQPPGEGIPGVVPPAVSPTFNNQTLRQIVHTSIGGKQVRVRLSNLFGTGDLLVGAACVGLRSGDAQILPNTNKVLTFSGRSAVTIPAGALVVSDPVTLPVPPLGDLSISIYLPNSVTGATQHTAGLQTNYILSGDQTGVKNPTVDSTYQSYYFLTNVEVYAPNAGGAIVCLGDSITDGIASAVDTNRRWPNFLAQRLLAQRGRNKDMGVLNQGIAGNRLLHNVAGPNAVSRFDRDVIAQPGVADVIVLEGINDLTFSAVIPTQVVTADDVIAAYRQLIIRAHEAGLQIYGATVTPFGRETSTQGAIHQAMNDFIRNSGEFDGVIDFQAAIRDPSNPTRIAAQYDSGDQLHPNDAGMEAMANAIDLRLFQHGND